MDTELLENEIKNRCGAFVLGQLLAALIAVTGVSSSLLAQNGICAPSTQSLLNYFLLAACFGPFILKKKSLQMPWKFYAGLAIIDIEANYAVILAYQYTSLTSVTLLDCWAIPCAMILTVLLMGNTYSCSHFVGAILCVLGLFTVFVSDVHSADWTGGSNVLLGDALVILGSTVYALSNVYEEYLVKRVPKEELLAMLGLFGFLFDLVQIIVLERKEVTSIKWSVESALPFVTFSVALFLFYVLTPIMLQISGSAMLNLSLLMSDIWAITIRALLFHQKVDWLYYVALIAVAVGLAIYSLSGQPGNACFAEEDGEESDRDLQAKIESERLVPWQT